MNKWLVRDTKRGTEREVSGRSEAEETKSRMVELGASPEQLEIVPPKQSDGGTVTKEPEVVEDTTQGKETEPAPAQGDMEALDELGESLETDPLSILPGHMVDTIQGTPSVNKRGYAMIAERYGVSVKSYIETYPWENENGRCVARAVATTEDGKEYQDYATASKDDGDMPEQLVELASTRALKRVTGWATGLGIVSYQELSNQLEDNI